MYPVQLDFRIGRYILEKPGFAVIKYWEVDPPATIVELDEMTQTCLDANQRRKVVVLIDARDKYTTWTDDMKDYVANNKDLVELQLGVAMLINTLAVRILVNAYFAVFKPPTPTKLFTDEVKAREWLEDKLSQGGIAAAG